MRKILWHSNAPWAPTGYGGQTALFAPKLAEKYPLWLSSNWGLEGAPLPWKGIPVLPGLGQSHGNETLPGHVGAIFDEPREGLVVTLYDAQVFSPELAKQINMVCWTPVDHDPAPPKLITFFRSGGAIPLAMSEFGMEKLAEFDPIYVPHGVDLDVYKRGGREEQRKMMGISEDAFVVGMVAANKGRPSRKGFTAALKAFRAFSETHDDAELYLHTTLAPEYSAGEDLVAMLGSLGINAKAPNQYPVMFSPPDPRTMARVYSTFDVLLNPSMGEGFGIPIAEAAAVGVPSIVNDFSAMPEVAGPGWAVPGAGSYWTGQASWMQVPDPAAIVGALEECYDLATADRKDLAQRLRTHVEDRYDAEKVFEDHLLPALEEVDERLGDRAPIEVTA